MRVFSVYCGLHLMGRFIDKKSAERLREQIIADNALDDYEIDIREHKI